MSRFGTQPLSHSMRECVRDSNRMLLTLLRTLVSHGCIAPMCRMLHTADPSTAEAILEGMENILRVGDADARRNWGGVNPNVEIIRKEAEASLIDFRTDDMELALKKAHILHRLGLLPIPPADAVWVDGDDGKGHHHHHHHHHHDDHDDDEDEDVDDEGDDGDAQGVPAVACEHQPPPAEVQALSPDTIDDATTSNEPT